jgi:hypothetical protein
MKKPEFEENDRLLFYKPWWYPLAEAAGFAVMIVAMLAVFFLLGA